MNEIELTYVPSNTLRAILTNAASQWWNFTTAAWETYAEANLAHYDLVLTGSGTNRWIGSLPSGVVWANCRIYDTAGALTAADLPNYVASGEVGTKPADIVLVNGAAFVLKSSLLTLTPFQATAANPRFGDRKQPAIAQASAPTDVWTITDANGAAVDLTGKTVRCVYALISDAGDEDTVLDDTLEGSFQYETGGDGITVGGDDGNQVTLVHDTAKTATPGSYRFFLWNITDNQLLLMGTQPIRPAVR